MDFEELTNEQRRQIIDSRQAHEAFWEVSDTLRHRFGGSRRWVTRKGRDDFHHKRGKRERSLGPRSPETEAQWEAFMTGREQCRENHRRLSARLDQMAPVNRALGLGRDGFLVDLIPPPVKDVLRPVARRTIGESDDDLHGAPIEGLAWLLNVPRFEAAATAEDGYAVRVTTIDPRAFALHKRWVSRRPERDPLKRPRDQAQARAAYSVARTYLGFELDDDALAGLPLVVRDLAEDLTAEA